MKKRLLALILIVTLLLTIPCFAYEAKDGDPTTIDGWQERQEQCHNAAVALRAVGFPTGISVLDSYYYGFGDEWHRAKEAIKELQAAQPVETETTKSVNIYDYFTESDICTMAEVMYAEYNGIVTILGEEKGGREVRRIGWCIMNRVDEWGGTLQSVANASGQFAHSYNSTPYYKYAKQMLEMYLDEKLNGANVRELDRKYKWYGGNGKYNTFRSYCYVNGGANHGWNLQVDREWQS